MIVESSRVSLDNLNDKTRKPGLAERIEASTMSLQRREKGLPTILKSSWDNSAFLDKFEADLNEIERINDRFERDITQKIQERRATYGEDGTRILGIDIEVKLVSPRNLPAFPRNPFADEFRKDRD